MLKLLLRSVLLLAPLVIGGCLHGDDSGPGPLTTATETCGVEQQNEFVYTAMQEWYYWYEQLPDVEPANFSSPYALLQAIRYETFDSTFSYITTQEAEQAFLNNSDFVGFGFSTVIRDGNRLFLREVFPGSPAADAGMGRGDEILAIDGVDVATLISADMLQDAYGPSEAGVTVEFELQKPDATNETVSVTKATVEIPVVLNPAVFDVNGTTTGYVYFRSFNNAAYDALDEVFAGFKASGVTQLVLDLRYNGGGLLAVAEYLGSLIRAEANAGAEFATLTFNDKKQANNVVLTFAEESNSLAISDIVIITTGSSASASELMISALAPYANVATVGATTFGKPVGQSGFNFCDKVLRAVTFETVNANDVGGYFNGIPPTCAAGDELAEPLGSLDEDSMAEAVNYLSTGSCSTMAGKAARNMAEQKALYPPAMQYRDGWDVLTGGAR